MKKQKSHSINFRSLELEDLYIIQKPLKDTFVNKFLFTRIFVQDLENTEDKALNIEETHCRAHTGLDENYKQINRLYYWPQLFIKLKEYIKTVQYAPKTNIIDIQ